MTQEYDLVGALMTMCIEMEKLKSEHQAALDALRVAKEAMTTDANFESALKQIDAVLGENKNV